MTLISVGSKVASTPQRMMDYLFLNQRVLKHVLLLGSGPQSLCTWTAILGLESLTLLLSQGGWYLFRVRKISTIPFQTL